jgi:hypothetical protein
MPPLFKYFTQLPPELRHIIIQYHFQTLNPVELVQKRLISKEFDDRARAPALWHPHLTEAYQHVYDPYEVFITRLDAIREDDVHLHPLSRAYRDMLNKIAANPPLGVLDTMLKMVGDNPDKALMVLRCEPFRALLKQDEYLDISLPQLAKIDQKVAAYILRDEELIGCLRSAYDLQGYMYCISKIAMPYESEVLFILQNPHLLALNWTKLLENKRINRSPYHIVKMIEPYTKAKLYLLQTPKLRDAFLAHHTGFYNMRCWAETDASLSLYIVNQRGIRTYFIKNSVLYHLWALGKAHANVRDAFLNAEIKQELLTHAAYEFSKFLSDMVTIDPEYVLRALKEPEIIDYFLKEQFRLLQKMGVECKQIGQYLLEGTISVCTRASVGESRFR